jgi:hypothetical protein
MEPSPLTAVRPLKARMLVPLVPVTSTLAASRTTPLPKKTAPLRRV